MTNGIWHHYRGRIILAVALAAVIGIVAAVSLRGSSAPTYGYGIVPTTGASTQNVLQPVTGATNAATSTVSSPPPTLRPHPKRSPKPSDTPDGPSESPDAVVASPITAPAG
jgi:hypothetical protein